MKLQKLVLSLCCSFSLMFFTGCVSWRNGTEISETQIPSITALADGDSTSTPGVIPLVATETATVIPTLESDKAYILLKSLIKGASDCQLPCWGGIIPGTSLNAQAEEILRPLFPMIYGGPPYDYKGREFSGPGGGRSFFFGDIEVSFVFGWLNEQGKDRIERLHVKADVFEKQGDGTLKPIYGVPAYNELFEEYSLHEILSRYGAPSRLLTFAYIYDHNDQPFPNPEEFQLLLLYDKGIFIEYIMPLKRIGGDKGMACPSEARFDIWLMPSESSQFFQEMWSSSTTDSPDFSDRLSIDESTQLTSDDFYKIFKESNSPCFETSLAIWPEH